MKKTIFYIAILSVMMGCKKTSYVPVFDKTPQERAADQIKLVSTTLTSAPNGWIATLPTFGGGGYGFYVTFDNQQNVTMYGDMTNDAASTVAKSYYRVKQDIGTDLVFDTYNYISMLDDPNNAVLGGTAKVGFSSDIEFIFDRINGDSIIFVGKKYRQPFKLVKATAAQQATYASGGYLTAIDKFKNFFTTIKNPYIEIVSGGATLKAGISVNTTNNLAAGKRVSLSGLLADGVTAGSGVSKFAFKLDGADLLGPGLVYQGVTLIRMAWKDATTMAFYDTNGKEYIVKSNPVPLTPLSSLFGYQTTYPYKKITIPTAGLPTGVTSGFTAVYNQMVALFVASGRSVTSTTFTLTSNTTFSVAVAYMSGTSAFTATVNFGYTRNGDVITLDNIPVVTSDNNWNTRAIQLKPLADYIVSGPFKIDWVTSTTPNSPNLGGLYRTADPTSFIYGTL
ncbi:DUF4302 domain-containing protein [Pedobacter sp. KR3-3]|uniref:DUF4302 domain-containing protein n=1 Tax=Pedobacter albus TaxID=3113905 RepID=A0ABU7I983_9SPHI|nr:DUF4302 domain-containing protein [Pedobacter sp. KR3-3]MEE1946037.1 DUF4302 domain-containing protein [Pedobacter sp. KR3-3]